jgi:hypothetical protein
MTKMKIAFILLLALTFSVSCTRQSKQLIDKQFSIIGDSIEAKDIIEPFRFTLIYSAPVSFYKMKYEITEKELKIKDIRIDLLSDSIVYKTQISQNIIDELSIINMDSLKEYYFNPCVMDGFSISTNIRNKTVVVSNFYLPEIGFIVETINSFIPEKYKIWYEKKRLIRAQERCKLLNKNKLENKE